MQDNILKGCLLMSKIEDAVPLRPDPVQIGWDFERLQVFCQEYYGRRLDSEQY
jgi:Txe/YoeB family toxin of Txe-Axe toxin-antitoxin module